MNRTAVPILAILVIVGVAPAQEQPAATGAEPGTLQGICLDLEDGATVCGKLEIDYLTVKTDFGVLKVPLSEIVNIIPGLESDPELAEKVGSLIPALASEKSERRDQAQKELAELGPRLKLILSEYATDEKPETRTRVAEILKGYETWAAKHPDAPKWATQPVNRLDRIQTPSSSFAGRIEEKMWTLTTDYGTLSAEIRQIRQVRKTSVATMKPTLRKTPLLEVELRDGSILKGLFESQVFLFVTPYGKIKVHPGMLQTATFSEDRKTADLVFRNGDRLFGLVDMSSGNLGMKTTMGIIPVPLNEIVRFDVLAGLSGPIRKGLVLYFTFDEKADKVKDWSGLDHPGLVCEAQYTPQGRSGGAYVLDGENDHIAITDSARLVIRKELTLAVWVNLASFGPGGYGNEHGYIINRGDDLWWNPAYCLGYAKGSGAGQPRWPGQPGPFPALFHVCNDTDNQQGGGKTVVSTTLLKPDAWYHLAGTYDGSALKIYINGKLEAQEAYSGLLRSYSAPVFVGGGGLSGSSWGNQFTVHGTIDEVIIWDRALAADEIASLCGR